MRGIEARQYSGELKDLLFTWWAASGGAPLEKKQIQNLRDLVRGKGRPDPSAKAKTPYRERIKEFRTRQDEAKKILKSIGK